MNRQEYIKKIQDDHAKTLETIERIPDDLPIQCADGINVSFHQCSYSEVPDRLSALRKSFGNYKLEYYFENSGLLAIRYLFDELDVHFYCSDFDNALEKIGKGKCSLETFDTTENRIVCSV